ncbi:hypothetical protein SAMN05444680_1206 [Variovorax sp. YR216]|nr:hypothetical protein SAMN05444680_1206 [Variovorax sp. YR216]
MSIDAEVSQERDPFQDLGDLARRVPCRCAPQPTLAVLAVCTRRVQCRYPAPASLGKHRCHDGLASRCFEFNQGGRHHGADDSVVHDEQAMLAEPLLGKDQEPLAVRAMCDFVPQDPYQCSALVLGHPLEAQAFAGLVLVIEQGASAGVQRAQRHQIRGGDVQLPAKVVKKCRGHDPHAVQRPTGHAGEADVQRQAQLEAVAAPSPDQVELCAAEAEERLQLELAELARHVAQPQVGRLPALHRRAPSLFRGPQTIRRKEVNSNAREINDLANRPRAVAGDANRQF